MTRLLLSLLLASALMGAEPSWRYYPQDADGAVGLQFYFTDVPDGYAWIQVLWHSCNGCLKQADGGRVKIGDSLAFLECSYPMKAIDQITVRAEHSDNVVDNPKPAVEYRMVRAPRERKK